MMNAVDDKEKKEERDTVETGLDTTRDWIGTLIGL